MTDSGRENRIHCSVCDGWHYADNMQDCRDILLRTIKEKDTEIERLKHSVSIHSRIGDELKEEKRKHKETEQAFEYAIHRYWKSYDQYGPYWRLFTHFACIVEAFDDKGKMTKIDDETFLLTLKEAKAQLAYYVKYVKENEEVQFFLKMEDEMQRFKFAHQTALDLLRKEA